MFRVGIVKAHDVTNGRVRVTFPDRDQNASWWLQIAVPFSQNNKVWRMPDIGEQVVCAMDARDEDGAVLGALYSTADTPPAGATKDQMIAQFSDGAIFEYDRSSHSFSVSIPSGGTVSISVNGASIAIDASGKVTITAASDAEVTAAGDIKLKTGTFNDSVNTIITTFNSHTHPDPQGGNTLAPNQVMP
jgi:phage baseplate assembly protein V